MIISHLLCWHVLLILSLQASFKSYYFYAVANSLDICVLIAIKKMENLSTSCKIKSTCCASSNYALMSQLNEDELIKIYFSRLKNVAVILSKHE